MYLDCNQIFIYLIITDQEKTCRSRAVHLHEVIQRERENLSDKKEELKKAEEEIVNNFISNMQVCIW